MWELYVWAVLTQVSHVVGVRWCWGGGDAEAAGAFCVSIRLPVNSGFSTWSSFLGLNLGFLTPW